MTFVRYDDADLNASLGRYDWKATDSGGRKDGRASFLDREERWT